VEALDKDGWPIVVGARVAAERGYKLTKLLPVTKHTPTCDERSAALRKKFGEAVITNCVCPRLTEQVVPTDECIVLGLSPHKVHTVVVELRDVTTHGRRTCLPSAVRVLRGDTKKSAIYREMTDPSYRALTKARRQKGAK
jgi:hypothetical protein